jgi:uncharacterized protein
VRALAKLLVFVALVALSGALLAPPLYWLGRWLVESGSAEFLAPFRFPKYFNRAVLLVALLGLWPLLRWLGLGSAQQLGLASNPRRWRDLGAGFGVGICGIACVAVVVALQGHVGSRDSWAWQKLIGVAATAIVVPLIEELFFRGALLGVFRRSLPPRWALAIVSAIFALVHFIKPNLHATLAQDVKWWSGLALLPRLLDVFATPIPVLLGLATLFLTGWVLGESVLRTRSLYLAIGLHSGWIFGVRSFRFVSRIDTDAFGVWLGRDFQSGLAPVALMLATWVIVILWLAPHRGTERSSQHRAST